MTWSKYLLLFAVMLPLEVVHAQQQIIVIQPRDLYRSDQVKLFMKDSSHFFGRVVSKPLRDRILFQTRNGELEIPLSEIDHAVDYAHNSDLSDDLKQGKEEITKEREKYHLEDLVANPKFEKLFVLYTHGEDVYRGEQYITDDPKHLIFSTEWGELFFRTSDIAKLKSDFENTSAKEKYTPDYLIEEKPSIPVNVIDPLASQGYITPNGISFGKGSVFLSDYFFGGLQINYGATDWLSMNLGGAYLPVAPAILVATGGAKLTPVSTELWHVSVGGQGMYSRLVKTTHLGLAYGAVTYGDNGSELTIFAGYTINRTDSLGYTNTKHDNILAVQGAKQAGTNIKLGAEFFFISDFAIVPLILTLRYFTNTVTVDIGVVMSLFKAGAVQNTKTLGEYVFNIPDFPIVPVISGSYHF